jgi:hypothetical protein
VSSLKSNVLGACSTLNLETPLTLDPERWLVSLPYQVGEQIRNRANNQMILTMTELLIFAKSQRINY